MIRIGLRDCVRKEEQNPQESQRQEREKKREKQQSKDKRRRLYEDSITTKKRTWHVLFVWAADGVPPTTKPTRPTPPPSHRPSDYR